MIIGLGHDIVSISRVEKLCQRYQTPFLQRICTRNEQEQISGRHNCARELAKLFAIKESASKAIGVGIRQGVSFHDFERRYNALKKPELILTGAALIHLEKQLPEGFTARTHLSYSDEEDMISAIVIIEAIPCS